MTKRRTAGRRRRRGQTSFRKLAISLPEDLAERLEREVESRHSPSVSAFISDVLSEKLKHDALQTLIDDIVGDRPLTQKERRWAAKIFGD